MQIYHTWWHKKHWHKIKKPYQVTALEQVRPNKRILVQIRPSILFSPLLEKNKFTIHFARKNIDINQEIIPANCSWTRRPNKRIFVQIRPSILFRSLFEKSKFTKHFATKNIDINQVTQSVNFHFTCPLKDPNNAQFGNLSTRYTNKM